MTIYPRLSRTLRLIHLSLLTLGLSTAVQAQVNTTESAQRSQAESRLQQQREQAQRQRLEAEPDVRLPAPARAPQQRLPTDETPCFTLQLITVQGQDEGGLPDLLGALAGLDGRDSPLGRCLGAQGIKLLLQRGQDALVAEGFITTRLLAAPQDLSGGTLALTVVPGRIRHIRFEDGAGQPTSIMTAVPARPGQILNLRDIEQALENFKRVNGAQVDIQITPAQEPNESDLVIRYVAGAPARLSFMLDDSGSKNTGKYQGSATLSLDNPLALNDLFYVTFNNDLGGGDSGPRGNRGNTVHYSLPWGYWSWGLTASESRYYQTVAGQSQNYVYSGTSGNIEIKASRLVWRDAQRKTTLSLKAFERHSKNYVDDTEVQVQRRVVGGWEWGVGHKAFVGSAILELNLAQRLGTGDFGTLPAPEEASGEGTSRFGLWLLDATLQVPFRFAGEAWHYSGSWRLQNNSTPLTPQDRFAIGGRYTVRGFDGEATLAAERGWLVRNELGLKVGDAGSELYLGLDTGEVGGPSSAQLAGTRLSGMVLGLRMGLGKLVLDVFAGGPLDKPEGFRTASVAGGFSLSLSF